MIRAIVPLTLLALAACTAEASPEGPPPPAPGKCVADGLDVLTGKTKSAAVSKQALRLSGAKTIRWIAPGMAVTMDFREDRLNLDTDANGKILSARCG